MTAVVFLGPSLPLATARSRLDATYLPPARCGDIYRAARDLRPTAILLLDGRFHDTASVWHREILWALAQGIHVFGAASMGALRAAELEAFGMRGIGRVHAAYRHGKFVPFDDDFDDDGEVAVAHAPAELGSGALSVALVDLRDALATTWSAGLLSLDERDRVLREAAALFYVDRGPEQVAALIATAIADPIARARLIAQIAEPGSGVKASDSLAALDEVARFLAASPSPFVASFALAPALVWQRFRQALDRPRDDDLPTIEAAVLDEMRCDPAAWQALRRDAVTRARALRPDASPAVQGHPDGATRRRAFAALRLARGLDDRGALEDWMSRNALSNAALDALVESEATLLATDVPRAVLERMMIEILRLDGRFESAVAHVQLSDADETRRAPAARAAHETALLAEFLDTHARFGTARLDVATLIRLLDCRDEAHLFRVLERSAARAAGPSS